jgi:hypothetical protein
MNLKKTSVIFLLCFLALLSCGIEELSYLPQVPESVITRTLYSDAEIRIPSNLLDQTHYASGYAIFYKIYIINTSYETYSDLITAPGISYDYGALLSYTDPSNTSSITSLNTFSNRGFYELELEGSNIRNTVLSKSGGTINIKFDIRPGERASIEYSGIKYILWRSNGGGAFRPQPTNRYFLNHDDLRNYSNMNATYNADVSGQNSANEYESAYASMYIVAVGQNPSNFTRLYGKPTHISIFKLTQAN